MLWHDPDSSFNSQEGNHKLVCRLKAFTAWLQTAHGQTAGPEVAELLLYAWLADGNFSPAFGQLCLLQDSMYQIAKFLQQARGSAPGSAGVIVALHANKPHDMGNMYDSKKSPTSAFLQACQKQFVPVTVKLLIIEAMPLQQFPGRCGGFGGVKPPFTHPQRYPRQAWTLGKLILHIQLTVLRNCMGRLGLAPLAYLRAMVSCGRHAAARFCPDANRGQSSFVHAAMLEPLRQQGTDSATQMPCLCTKHPAALAWHGLGAAEQLISAFMEAASLASNSTTARFLAPAFTSDSISQLLKRMEGAGYIPRLLVGDVGLATIYNNRYLGLSAAFINSKLAGLPNLPRTAKLLVGKTGCPSPVHIIMSRTTSSSGQMLLRVLGFQYLLPLLQLDSKQAAVRLLPGNVLLVCLSPSPELSYTPEELQQKHQEAEEKIKVRLAHLAKVLLCLVFGCCSMGVLCLSTQVTKAVHAWGATLMMSI